MASYKKLGSYGQVLQVSSVKPDKYGKCVKIKINSSIIVIDKNQVKELIQYLIEKHL